MKLFICWSGVRGQALAGVMAKRLPEIIEGVQPFVSTGIAKGRLWFLEVGEHLRSASAGLICLTRESLGSSWIHYEAGVLARAVSEREEAQAAPGRIFTYLLDVDPTEVVGPLSAYQSSVATREDMLTNSAIKKSSTHTEVGRTCGIETKARDRVAVFQLDPEAGRRLALAEGYPQGREVECRRVPVGVYQPVPAVAFQRDQVAVFRQDRVVECLLALSPT
jgi:hypothetical protein